MADDGELDIVAGEIEQQGAVKQEPEVKNLDDELPEEFRGKSASEIAKIAIHARGQMGKMGNELGEVRRLADELIKSQLKPKEQVEQPKEIDFFENPQEAIRRAVETNPKVIAAEKYAEQTQKQIASQRLWQAHPDFMSIVQDASFQAWVDSSPVRKKLLKDADGFDFDSANELLSTFKELKAVRNSKVTEVEKAARDKAITSAAVDSGGSGESGKKIYRRADILKIMMRPEEYRSKQAEIEQAYAEGRVR